MRRRRMNRLALAIATVALVFTTAASVAAQQDDPARIAAEVDAYWSERFAALGIDYVGPEIVTVSDAPCGFDKAVAACDGAVEIDPLAYDDLTATYGDIAGVLAIARTFGYVALDQIAPGADLTTEGASLYADCVAGVYIGKLWFDFRTDEGDVYVAVVTLPAVADDADAPGDARVLAFMSGFVVGFEACDPGA
jgi:predicted metalloprotease